MRVYSYSWYSRLKVAQACQRLQICSWKKTRWSMEPEVLVRLFCPHIHLFSLVLVTFLWEKISLDLIILSLGCSQQHWQLPLLKVQSYFKILTGVLKASIIWTQRKCISLALAQPSPMQNEACIRLCLGGSERSSYFDQMFSWMINTVRSSFLYDRLKISKVLVFYKKILVYTTN